jgi:multidrug efflux pump subunit AcrA (membrane-fusion protein)
VLLVSEGKVKQVPITIGFNNGSFTEVKSGLTGNEDVIVSSRENLGNGMPVQIENAAAPTGAAK